MLVLEKDSSFDKAWIEFASQSLLLLDNIIDATAEQELRHLFEKRHTEADNAMRWLRLNAQGVPLDENIEGSLRDIAFSELHQNSSRSIAVIWLSLLIDSTHSLSWNSNQDEAVEFVGELVFSIVKIKDIGVTSSCLAWIGIFKKLRLAHDCEYELPFILLAEMLLFAQSAGLTAVQILDLTSKMYPAAPESSSLNRGWLLELSVAGKYDAKAAWQGAMSLLFSESSPLRQSMQEVASRVGSKT